MGKEGAMSAPETERPIRLMIKRDGRPRAKGEEKSGFYANVRYLSPPRSEATRSWFDAGQLENWIKRCIQFHGAEKIAFGYDSGDDEISQIIKRATEEP